MYFHQSSTVHFIDPWLAVAQSSPCSNSRGSLSVFRVTHPLSSPTSSQHTTNELLNMALVRKYSSVPTPLYNIQPNDLLGQNYEAPTNVTFCMASEESFYRPSLNEVEQTEFLYPRMPELVTGTCYEGLPTLQPYNAGPYLQTQPSFSTVFSPISGSLASPQGALNPSPASLRKEVQKANPKEKGKRTTRNATQSAKQELLIGKPKRKRGPNKQRSDTSFSYLFVRSFCFLSGNMK